MGLSKDDQLIGWAGSKQLSTTGSDISEKFYAFIPEQDTVISAIYIERNGVEVDVINEITDNPAHGFSGNALIKAFKEEVFTKVNITSGKITIYREL